MKPHKSILDPTFEYRSAASTDIRILFRRIRRQLREAQAAAEAMKQPAPKVAQLKRAGAKS